MKPVVVAVVAIALLLCPVMCGAKVSFDASGTALVDGVPFFPVGVFLYEFNTNVLAEIHQQGFNTVLYAVKPSDLDTLQRHGLMTVPYATEDFLAVKNHPSILAWYLADEPEGHGQTPEQMRSEHDRIRSIDPDHPVGLCHFLWSALEKYKDASDYVMSDVYPVTAHRDQPVTPLAAHIDELHRIHGKAFPVWPAIQVFGGPETDGGKWAEPTPVEVRCMTYLALAHGAKAMLYFSYWPKLPRTWAEVGKLTREIHRLTPFLVAPGEDVPVKCVDQAIHSRCIRTGKSGIVIAVNVDPTFRTAKLKVAGVSARSLSLPFESRAVSLASGEFTDHFLPYEAHVYQWGDPPSTVHK